MRASDRVHERLVSMLRRFAPTLAREDSAAELLAGAATWISLPGGNVLFDEGVPSDSIYIIVSGLLGVVAKANGGKEYMVGRLGPGEIVGEMGCIAGQPRSATVLGLRSSEILKIEWTDVVRISRQDPRILLSICQTVVERFGRKEEGRAPRFHPSTFAVVGIGEGVDGRRFAGRFRDALSSLGDAFLATREEHQNATLGEINEIEQAHDYLVYLADRSNAAWTSQCIRQSDIVIAVGRGSDPPHPVESGAKSIGPNTPVILVLHWDANVQPTNTVNWIKATGASRHFHVRGKGHVRRIARLLSGKGLGLVLSGGGARGLAHIGVLKALREHGIQVDIVMGTSIGALIGAGIALEWDVELIVEKIRGFVSVSPLVEITIPRTSILSGRKIRNSFNTWFQDLQIEDMPVPYSCVSANLNTGEVAVHDSGHLKTWIRASAAVPGVFPPVIADGVMYVDGGVLNNMPTDLIREFGAGFVVGVDVAGALGSTTAADGSGGVGVSGVGLNLLELLTRVGSIGDGARAITRRKECDVLIVPKMSNIGLLNFKAYQRAIDAGYNATLEVISEISHELQKPVENFLEEAVQTLALRSQ